MTNQHSEHIEDERLQQYFDGELGKRPQTLVREHLTGCDSCTERHQSLTQLSQMVRIAAEDVASDVDFDSLFGRVELGMRQKDAPGLGEQIRVWWDEFVEHQSQVWMPATGAVAVAAAVLLTLYLPGTPIAPDGPDVPGAGAGPELAQRPLAPSEGPSTIPAEPPVNTEITEADFGENAGTVFEIALAEGVSTQVVWINDEDFE